MRYVVAFVLLVMLFIFAVFVLPPYRCRSQWEDSGLKSKFEYGIGCRVQLKDGTWVPANNLRLVESK